MNLNTVNRKELSCEKDALTVTIHRRKRIILDMNIIMESSSSSEYTGYNKYVQTLHHEKFK